MTCAAGSGHLPLVEYLVERGDDVEAKDVVRNVMNAMIVHVHDTCICKCECVSVEGLH